MMAVRKTDPKEKKTWRPRMTRDFLEHDIVSLKDLFHFSEYVRHWAASEGEDAAYQRMSIPEFDAAIGYSSARLVNARLGLEAQTGAYLMDLWVMEGDRSLKDDKGRPRIARSLIEARASVANGKTKGPADVRMVGEMWGALGSYIYDLIEITKRAQYVLDWTVFLEQHRKTIRKIKTPEDWDAFLKGQANEDLTRESGSDLLEAQDDLSDEELEALEDEERRKEMEAERERQEAAENAEIKAHYDLVAETYHGPLDRMGMAHRPRPGSKLAVYDTPATMSDKDADDDKGAQLGGVF